MAPHDEVDLALKVLKEDGVLIPPSSPAADHAYDFLDNVVTTTTSPGLLRFICHELLDYAKKGK